MQVHFALRLSWAAGRDAAYADDLADQFEEQTDRARRPPTALARHEAHVVRVQPTWHKAHSVELMDEVEISYFQFVSTAEATADRANFRSVNHADFRALISRYPRFFNDKDKEFEHEYFLFADMLRFVWCHEWPHGLAGPQALYSERSEATPTTNYWKKTATRRSALIFVDDLEQDPADKADDKCVDEKLHALVVTLVAPALKRLIELAGERRAQKFWTHFLSEDRSEAAALVRRRARSKAGSAELLSSATRPGNRGASTLRRQSTRLPTSYRDWDFPHPKTELLWNF